MNLALKAKYSFYSALVFFLIANPETYKIINSLLGRFIGAIASVEGCPTPFGFFLHTFFFFLVMLGLMMFPRD
jgi:hypothetical protein